jgi:phthiocerol/phenolphthiocerol synthesis type-I polyketide synthase E
MGTSAVSNTQDRETLKAPLLRGLQEWCARETGASDAKSIDPDKPFHCHNPEWGKRFKLRNTLLSWVLENTALTTFYPDELEANSTPRLVAEHLAERMASGRERPVRPPVIPRKTGKIEEPTVFVLGCPRSGTTIFRCMLMGHPNIYAGPELHMMQFDSLLQRERALVDIGTSWMVMGFSQTIQDLTGWSERQAFHYVSTLTKRDLPVQEVYRIIHGYCPRPMIVDKSPSLARSLATMEKIEKLFANPRYLYITRHPYAVIESMMRMQILPPLPKFDLPTAEAMWSETNSNIRTFLSGIPCERWHRLSYEDLMRNTGQTLRGVTDFLGLAFEPAMSTPYEGNRVLHGIGCVNLPKRQRVEPELAEKWKAIRLERPLLPATFALAGALGYECP